MLPSLLLGCGKKPEPDPTGFVRAHVIDDAADLSTGPRAAGRLGDYRLLNDHVAFVIADAPSVTALPFAGGLVDADFASDAVSDALGDAFFRAGDTGVVALEAISIEADGSDERSATVVASGPVVGFAGLGDPESFELFATTRYTIRPFTHHIEIETMLRNDGAAAVEVPVSDVLGVGPEARVFESGSASSPNWIVAAHGDIAYGLVPDELRLHTDPLAIPAGGTRTYRRRLFVGATAGEVTADIYDTLHVPTGTLVGFIRDLAGDVAEDALLDVRSSDGRFLSQLAPDSSGAFATKIPADRLELVASSAARGGSADPLFIDLASGKTANVIVLLPATGLVQFRAVDASTTDPIPARLRLFRDGKLVASAVSAGELATARSLPGEHTAVISRGPEWTRVETAVQVLAGQTINATVDGPVGSLDRVVDTTDFVVVEPQVRSRVSIDGAEDLERVLDSLAAEGVENSVHAEHNRFGAAVTRAGLGAWDGVGIVAPARLRLAATAASAPDEAGARLWYDADAQAPRTFADLETGLRSLGDVSLIAFDARGNDGYLDAVGYDAADGSSDEPLIGLEALEVSSPDDPVLVDWLSLLARGTTVTAIATGRAGNGYPRTLVDVGTDDPSTVTAADLTAALRAQRALVSSGPFMRVTVSSNALSATLGETLDASGTACAVDVDVHVESPAWASFDTVRILTHAGDSATIVTPSLVGGRFVADVTVPVTPAADTFLVAIVEGDGTMFPVSDIAVFAIANPVYVDCAGDGWTPPL